jgi:hypothetical protein
MLFAVGSLVLSGCGTKKEAVQPLTNSANPAAEAPADVVVTPAMTTILAEADAKDGQDDKTVSLCASCALMMAGSPEHSLKVGEYTMCFCKDSCKEEFGKDIPQHVLAMELPKADAAEKQ